MRERLDLNGEWEFELDPFEKGVAEAYYNKSRLSDTIRVPGCWQMQNKHLPKEMQNSYSRHGVEQWKAPDGSYLIEEPNYYGTAWYARDIEIPEDFRGDELWLVLEGVHSKAQLWLDGCLLAVHEDGPWLPMRIRLSGFAKFGSKQRLALRFSDELNALQGVVKSHFRGIWKPVYIEATKDIVCTDLYARGDPFTGKVDVEAQVEFLGAERPFEYEITCSSASGQYQTVTTKGVCAEGLLKTGLTVAGARLWEPDDPQLYSCTLKLLEHGKTLDEVSVRFGFRSFETKRNVIYLNGDPIFMRGCGNAGRWQPEDFAPAINKDFYIKLVNRVKEYGYNWLRFHSAPTPDDCLDAADELGLMMSQELFLTLWETEKERSITRSQWERLIKKVRNHPCIWVWSMGNEMDSSNPIYNDLITEMYYKAKELTPGILITPSDGLNRTSFNEQPNDVYMVSPGVGVSVGSVLDIAPATRLDMSGVDMPLVVHELGYVESLPRPYQFDLPKDKNLFSPMLQMERTAKAKGIGEKELELWGSNSERLVTRCYYMGMENLRKVDGLAGYNQWVFTDDANERSGIVTPWLEDKAGMDAEICRRVNGVTAMSMTPLRDRYTLFDGEDAQFMLHVSHHGKKPLAGTVHWQLMRGSERLDRGQAGFAVDPIRVADIGPVIAKNPACGSSCELKLEAWIDTPSGKVANEWNLWSFRRISQAKPARPVYQLTGVFAFVEDRPSELFNYISNVTETQIDSLDTDSVVLANSLLPSVVRFLNRGGRVVYCPTYYMFNAMCLPNLPSNWNNLPTWAGDNGNFGSVIYDHKALEGFPHEGWADYNFFDLLSGARVRSSAPYWNMIPKAFDLDAWPVKIDPVIRSVGYTTKLTNRANLFEVAVEQGKLMAASLRLYESMGTHPETQYLFENIVHYAASDEFVPRANVSAEQFSKLILSQTAEHL
jgi:beta-galactosidase